MVFPESHCSTSMEAKPPVRTKSRFHWHDKGIPVYNFHANKPDLMKKLDLSVTKVIIFTLVAVSTLVLSAFGIACYCWKRQQTTSVLKSQLAVTTAQMASSLAMPLWNFDNEQVDKILESIMRNRDVFGVFVTGAGGNSIISGYTRDARWRPVQTKVGIRKNGLLSLSEKITIHDNHVGTVQLFITPIFMERSLHGFSAIIITAIVTLNAFLIIIPFLLLRGTVIKPLKAIESYALDVSSGKEETAAVPEGHFFGELQNLRQSIVEMTRGLAEARRDHVRKTEEQLLHESEKTLKSFIDVMPVGVTWSDAGGAIKHVNNCFVEWFGYDTSDIPTMDEWFLRAYPDSAKRQEFISQWESATDKAISEGAPFQPTECIIARKDGRERHVIVNTQLARNLRLDIFTDITERESLRNRLLNAQRLESLGVLAGGIAHDFNNILTGIMGNVSMARMVLSRPEKTARLLDNAEKASVRAKELATQLLTFAKGGAPVKKAVSIPEILNESLSLSLRGTNIKGVLEIPDCLYHIEADEGQINQVFNNIIINAVQSMPGGGIITVHGMNAVVEKENTFMLPPGEYVKLSFTDEGCGMPEDVLKKIFDPYFTTKPNGIGLGLASVHSIIKRHGGHIEAGSILGQGTQFTIYLPSTGKAAQKPVTRVDNRNTQPHEEGSILFMDDEEMIRELASDMLRHLGYEVTTCASGEEAEIEYRAAKENQRPYSLVILDLTIPGGKGGRESAKDILAFDPCARLIASSGYSHDPVIANFHDFGFIGSIVKPYTMEELKRVLAGNERPCAGT